MKTVRIENGIVAEVIPEYALPIESWYPSAFAALCVEAPDEIGQGWRYDAESGTFSAPVDPTQPIDPNIQIQLAVAELAETMISLNLENKLAIAELAEATLGGGT